LNATYNPVSSSDSFSPGALLHVKNVSGSSCTVSLVPKQLFDGLTLPNKTVTVPATTGERFIKVSADSMYRDPDDGLVEVLFSVQTSVSVAVLTS
jgi:hypothetical protein